MIKHDSMSWFNREDTKAVHSGNIHRAKGRISHVIIRVIVKQGRNESKCACSEKQSKAKASCWIITLTKSSALAG